MWSNDSRIRGKATRGPLLIDPTSRNLLCGSTITWRRVGARDVDNHGGDVVGPAGVVGRPDQGVARAAGIPVCSQDLRQRCVLDHAVQAVATQQDAIPGTQVHRGHVGQRGRGPRLELRLFRPRFCESGNVAGLAR